MKASPAVVKFLRAMAAEGGRARKRALSPARRSAIAKKAVAARIAKNRR